MTEAEGPRISVAVAQGRGVERSVDQSSREEQFDCFLPIAQTDGCVGETREARAAGAVPVVSVSGGSEYAF